MLSIPKLQPMYVLLWLFRFFTVLLLLTAVLGKSLDFYSFSQRLIDLGTPQSWARGLSIIVMAVELFLAVGLIIGRNLRLMWRAALALFLTFALAHVWQNLRGIDGDCKCFGLLLSLNQFQSLVLVVVMACIALVGLRYCEISSRSGNSSASALKPFTTSGESISPPYGPAILEGPQPTHMPLLISVMLSAMVAVTTVITPEVIRFNAPISFNRFTALPLGSATPVFNMIDDAGVPITHQDLREKAKVLLFISSCHKCNAGTVMTWSQILEKKKAAELFVLAPNDRASLKEFRMLFRPQARLLSTQGTDLAERFLISEYPMAYGVDRNGKIFFAQKDGEEASSAANRLISVLAISEKRPNSPSL